jgi:MFS family permease
MASESLSESIEENAYAKAARKLIPFLFICYVVAFLDRVNVGFAKLQMAPELQFSDAVYGFGAGIFFIGYFIFEVPSNIILEKVGARAWIARIMVTWGIISSAFMYTDHVAWGPIAQSFGCTDSEFTFYVLRFLLGVAEAGFFPGIILYLTYWFPDRRRTKMVALFMTAIAVSNLVGSPLSGGIMQYMDGAGGLSGWRWLFLLEGIPSVLVGVLVLVLLPNGPRDAKWLTEEERDAILSAVERDKASKTTAASEHNLLSAFADIRIWALAAIYFSGVICFYALNFWMPTIIQELGVDKKDFLKVGLISIVPWGLAAIFMVYWGAHSDKTGERRWHVAGSLLISMAGLILLALAGKSPLPAMVGLTIVAAGTLAFVSTFWSLPTAFLTGTAAAAGIALINSIGNLGGHFGPDLIGRIRALSNGATEAAFWALAAMACAGMLITLWVSRSALARPESN